MDYTPTGDAPEAIGLAGFTPSDTPPSAIADNDFAPTADAPAAIGIPDFTPSNAPAVPIGWNNQPAGVPIMPSVFTPAFIELTGGGPSLATLTASVADATAGRILTGTVGGRLKNYQVRAGTDAQALPGIVRPSNYNADTNAVLFVSC